MQLYQLTAHELHEKLKKKEISSVELTKSVFERISKVEGKVSSYLSLMEQNALQDASEADKRLAKNENITFLTGIPVAVKDNICVKGVPTTCGSKILENFYPPYEAAVVRKLRASGAVITGKTNMDEFAMGSSTENSAFFITKNPWDIERVPGGSSGGSSAAAAACECILALGSDTGGSIRQPVAFCGVTGLKPTYGLVSRYGLVAFASSLDQIGPIGRDVLDCAIAVSIIGGHDKKDSTSANVKLPDYLSNLGSSLKGRRFGIVKEFMAEGLDSEIAEVIKNAVKFYEGEGAVIEEVSLPFIRHALPAYYIIAPAEASSNLARYDGARYGYRDKDATDIFSMFSLTRQKGFGPEVKRRIMIGTYALSAGYYEAFYLKAQKVRTLIKKDFDEAFKKCDILLAPSTPTTAFKIGENIQDPLKMYLSDVYTVAVNLAGLPGLVVPCGFAGGLPVGLQLIGKAFDESSLFNDGHIFQTGTDYHKKLPKL